MAPLTAFLPSPGEWGRELHLYGIMIGIGVIVALELARRRWRDRGGDPEDMSAIAMWGVPIGLVGARLYHVVTDNQLYRGHWLDALDIRSGGLGIPGGIVAGFAVVVVVARRRHLRLPVALDVIAPSMAVAQAIGRWGNYFNQELFGRPSTLPWALTVDPAYRPSGLESSATYHPTFLYEMLWNLALAALLILVARHRTLRPGRIFALWLGGYFAGRLWVEALRSDTANTIAGLRVNTWTSLLVIVGVAGFIAISGLRRQARDQDDPYTDDESRRGASTEADDPLGVSRSEGRH